MIRLSTSNCSQMFSANYIYQCRYTILKQNYDFKYEISLPKILFIICMLNTTPETPALTEMKHFKGYIFCCTKTIYRDAIHS